MANTFVCFLFKIIQRNNGVGDELNLEMMMCVCVWIGGCVCVALYSLFSLCLRIRSVRHFFDIDLAISR